MKITRAAKVWLIVAASLVAAGILLFGGIMIALEWDFTELSTTESESNRYAITQPYRHISVVTDTADVRILPSETDQTTVVCMDRRNLTHTVTVADGTLMVELRDTRKWYDYIGIFSESDTVTVYLPRGEYGALTVHTSTGDLEIAEDFVFEGMDLTGSTGDTACYASVSGALRIRKSTGDIQLESLSAGSLELKTSTGDITATGVTVAGDVKLFHLPHTSRQSETVAHGGRGGNGADFVGSAANGEVLGILKDGIKFEGIHQPFAAQTKDQLFVLRQLQPVVVDHGEEEGFVVLGFHIAEGWELENAVGEIFRCDRAHGGNR